ncbi:hypothetical protein AB1Y20_013166 [Prymnesium parvum]|uniref:Uncharacterized protein n=1 Tax=Prymnesium parvum TaxID=97485 RepID=A0AB34IMM8_PRYPA
MPPAKVQFQWDEDPDLAIDYPTNFDFSNKGQKLRRRIGEDIEPAFGKPVMRTGQHTFSFQINQCWDNRADSLVLGVCDADKEKLYIGWKEAMDPANGVAWGIYCISGTLLRCVDITEKNAAGHGKPLMQGNLFKRARGAVVRFFVDMDEKKVELQVNNDERVDLEIERSCFPAGLRPWILIGNADSISISGT